MQLAAQKLFRQNMEEKLAKRPWIAEKRMLHHQVSCGGASQVLTVHALFCPVPLTTVIPDFPVACRRLTPGPGYLEALCEDNVSTSGASFRACRISHTTVFPLAEP